MLDSQDNKTVDVLLYKNVISLGNTNKTMRFKIVNARYAYNVRVYHKYINQNLFTMPCTLNDIT